MTTLTGPVLNDFTVAGGVPANGYLLFELAQFDPAGVTRRTWKAPVTAGEFSSKLPDSGVPVTVKGRDLEGFPVITIGNYAGLPTLTLHDVLTAVNEDGSAKYLVNPRTLQTLNPMPRSAFELLQLAAQAATAAAEDAEAAATAADSAQADRTAAGTSAFNAASSAATALGHANDAASSALNAARQLEASRNAYNSSPSQLQKVRAKLAQTLAKIAPAKIAYIGHSMVAGTGAAPGDTDWPTQFARFLEREGYARSGEGFVAGTKNAPDARVTTGAGWSSTIAGSHFIETSTATAPMVFQSIEVATEVDVHYALGTGPFSVSIDGGAPVTVTPAGGVGYGKATYSGLPSATHSVTILRISGRVMILGVDFYRSVPALRHYNVGVGGQRIGNVASTSGNFPGSFLASIVKPDLVFLECIYNDASDGLALATFKTNVQLFITRMSSIGATVVLLTDTPVGRAASIAEPYTNALYELARDNNLLLLDMLGALAGAVANGLISADNTHPTPAGYAAQARAVYKGLAL